jgi:site-specific recombinase XerC
MLVLRAARSQSGKGEGAKGQGSALFGQALEALKTYLAVREVSPEYDNVFLARNKTSMDQRTVYRIQKYYKEAGIRKRSPLPCG